MMNPESRVCAWTVELCEWTLPHGADGHHGHRFLYGLVGIVFLWLCLCSVDRILCLFLATLFLATLFLVCGVVFYMYLSMSTHFAKTTKKSYN